MAELTLHIPPDLEMSLKRAAASERKSIEDIAVERLAALLGAKLPVGGKQPEGMETSPAMDRETQAWLDADLGEELPPYDWGDVDPLELGEPVRYVPGAGLVVEREAADA